MTSLDRRPNTALLVLDVQQRPLEGTYNREAVIATIATLVRQARGEGVPVAHHGVGRVVVAGAQTDMCVRGTLHGAFTRGYDVTLVEDAHTTEDLRPWGVPVSPEQVVRHTNTYWTWVAAPGRTGTVVPAPEVDLGTGTAST